jgi:hypothetical protein
MVVKLLEALNKRFKAIEENKFFAEATMLDPRFKRHWLSDSQCFERAKQSLLSHCEKSKHGHATLVSTVPEVSENGSSVWDDFDKSVSTFVRKPHPRAAGIIEVNKFNDEPLLPRQGIHLLGGSKNVKFTQHFSKWSKDDCVLLQLLSLAR